MSEENWGRARLVFRACLPRQGLKVADNRRLLAAPQFLTLNKVRWRAVTKECGDWNREWMRFSRLSVELISQ